MTSQRLLAVIAHPDDEFGVGGTMAAVVAGGGQVVLACATRGEVGEISAPGLATRESLGAVREAELRAACAALGVSDVRFLGYRDSGMAGTPENEDPRSYQQANPQAATQKIVALIREVRPQVVVTFEPHGGYGHPDHVAASRYTTRAFDLAADTSAYPDVGAPWQPQRLFYVAFPQAWFTELREKMDALGLDTSWMNPLDRMRDDSIDDQITHVVDVGQHVEAKWTAFGCHQTQFGPDHPLWRVPPELAREMIAREFFIQARPVLTAPPGADPVRDLFAGL